MEEAPKEIMIAAKERGPGPGIYLLPTTVGFEKHDFTKNKAPAYTFGLRLTDMDYKSRIGPGPTIKVEPEYTRHGKDGTPKYTMRPQTKAILGGSIAPAPGTYAPEKKPHPGVRAPAYSMSARTAMHKRDVVPAPNTYSLPQYLGPKIPDRTAAAAYTMTARPQGMFGANPLFPSPASYQTTHPDITKLKAPVYSMKGRSFMPGDTTLKPGPGAHRPEEVNVTHYSPPKFSMGIRHSPYITELMDPTETRNPCAV